MLACRSRDMVSRGAACESAACGILLGQRDVGGETADLASMESLVSPSGVGKECSSSSLRIVVAM